MKKFLFIVIIFFFSSNSIAEERLVGKVIFCTKSADTFLVLWGIKFLPDKLFKWYVKSTEKESITDIDGTYMSDFNNIELRFKAVGGEVRNFWINRTNLEISEFGVTSPTMDKGECAVSIPNSHDFKLLFKAKYAQQLVILKSKKKI